MGQQAKNTSMTEVYHCPHFGGIDWRVLLGREVGAKCTFLVGMRLCPHCCQQLHLWLFLYFLSHREEK